MSAGRLLARVTALPAVALGAWLLVAFPLLYVGHFTPLAGALLGLPAILLASGLVLRWVPDLPKGTPWWSPLGTLTVVAGFAAVQMAYHSETIVIRRDAGSYAQFTAWIAENGALPIPQNRELIAGDDPALGYDSLAYYEVGDVIWPQFLSGAPLTYAPGHWLGGVDGMLLVPALAGALGVLSFAGLTARLVGPRWAPLAALVLAASLPQQWVSRATYSEPVAQVMLLGALVLACDALDRGGRLRDPRGRGHALAATAGLAFGLGLVVRIDALRDLLPVVGFIGLLLLAWRTGPAHSAAGGATSWAARLPPAVSMLAGLLLGLAYGYLASFVLSAPYIEYLAGSVRPLLAIAVGVTVATAVTVLALWWRGLPLGLSRTWLPTAVGVGVALLLVGFTVRPLLHTERGHGTDATGDYVAYIQELEGLAVDPSRNYQEMSLHWVSWYVGWPVLVLAVLAAALLWRAALRGTAPRWVLPLMVLSWSVVTTLARPAITPDHPWASRRLVVLVIPAFVLLAVWALAWLTRRAARYRRSGDPAAAVGGPGASGSPPGSPSGDAARARGWGDHPLQTPGVAGDAAGTRRWAGRRRGILAGALAAVGAVLLLAPTAVTASPLMTYRTDVGSVAEMERLCEAIPDDGSVVILDGGVGQGFAQLIRGMCGAPTAHMYWSEPEEVRAVVAEIEARDRVPVLVGAEDTQLTPYASPGSWPRRTFHVDTDQDPSSLMRPPGGPWLFGATVYTLVAPEPVEPMP